MKSPRYSNKEFLEKFLTPEQISFFLDNRENNPPIERGDKLVLISINHPGALSLLENQSKGMAGRIETDRTITLGKCGKIMFEVMHGQYLQAERFDQECDANVVSFSRSIFSQTYFEANKAMIGSIFKAYWHFVADVAIGQLNQALADVEKYKHGLDDKFDQL